MQEINFDCLAGPTHHFGGLSLGNLASAKSKAQLSFPKLAALEGLRKMKILHERGFLQAILPPHPRPFMPALERIGFSLNNPLAAQELLEKNTALFSLCSSSAFMWSANAATFSPSIDSLDKKAHITPANLVSMFHRSLEADYSYKLFKRIFFDESKFMVHKPLPPHDLLSDEGAANHSRLAPTHAHSGLQLFVYGKESFGTSQKTKIYPARQSKIANETIARLHALDENAWLNIEQNPEAIDAGAFHNDVVCVANEKVLLLHEQAFFYQPEIISTLKQKYLALFNEPLIVVELKKELLPLSEAVKSYLFNSQLLSKNNGKMLLFAPLECKENLSAQRAIKFILETNNPIDEIMYFKVSESMANGGGPACLRLRILLSEEERNSINQKCLFNNQIYKNLCEIIEKYYPVKFSLQLLLESKFRSDCQEAVSKINQILGLENL